MENNFPKSEHLCSKTLFAELMSEGNGLTAFPFRLIWKEASLPSDVPYQVAFSVSKRRFKKAVDRNRMKRVLREAWRLNKDLVLDHLDHRKVAFLIVYLSNDKMDFSQAEPILKKALVKWQNQFAEHIRQ